MSLFLGKVIHTFSVNKNKFTKMIDIFVAPRDNYGWTGVLNLMDKGVKKDAFEKTRDALLSEILFDVKELRDIHAVKVTYVVTRR